MQLWQIGVFALLAGVYAVWTVISRRKEAAQERQDARDKAGTSD